MNRGSAIKLGAYDFIEKPFKTGWCSSPTAP
jgi:FixJ family two-component response regulator